MSRSARLLDLLQALRRRTLAVRAQTLADEMGVHVRTLYRDIDTLRAQGAPIEGEAGVGYVLRPGFTLPPLAFRREEVEALVLGARWVARRGDPTLTLAARDALAKIAAVLTPALRDEIGEAALLVGGRPAAAPDPLRTSQIRRAIRAGAKLRLVYEAADGARSDRVVWPFCLGFFEEGQVAAAWCEARRGFRHFRLDRIVECHETGDPIPEPRGSLLARWQEDQNIPADAFRVL